MNYIDVSLNLGSEIKLKNEKGLINTVTEVYTVCTNAAYTVGYPFIKKCY